MNSPKKLWKFLVGIGVPIVILLLPAETFMLGDITVLEHRLLAIFAFAVLFWVLEPIPVFATSVAIITLELLMISDRGLLFLQGPGKDAAPEQLEAFGNLVSYKTLMGTFASPSSCCFWVVSFWRCPPPSTDSTSTWRESY